jgi:two-component system OmpR family sensor kinase
MLGLLVADFATYESLRSFLNGRVEHQLEAARFELLEEFEEIGEAPPPTGKGPRLGHEVTASFPSGSYGQLRRPDGSIVAELWLGDPDERLRPRLPDRMLDPGDVDATTFAARSEQDSSVAFRVSVGAAPDDETLVVAVPLDEMRQTLAGLLRIMLAVGIAVLLALAVTAWWVVRIGLRPLEGMGQAAAEIAAGDLSRRVEPSSPRTEIGRLGSALNAMLAQIEEAFAERRTSEHKLRRFLADASHELRTPLTSIRGYAELFRRGASARPDDLAKSMQRIEQEAAVMGALVEDLLLLARLDQGRPLEVKAIDLSALATDAVAGARAVDPRRSITLAAPSPTIVEADEVGLRQVMSNLVMNALNHTPADTPIEVCVIADHDHADFVVVDHGTGLAPGEADRVFERFYRADPSRARETGGVGLGLAIVSAIAEAHGGRVTAEATPGGGATFRVTLPVTASPAIAQTTRSE